MANARISYDKLNNLRSGNTVWKVYGNARRSATGGHTYTINVVQLTFVGKKYNNRLLLGSQDSFLIARTTEHLDVAVDGDGKRIKRYVSSSYKDSFGTLVAFSLDGDVYQSAGIGRYLSDAHGFACFTSRRAAIRYAVAVLNGRYTELIERMEDACEEQWRFDAWVDYTLGDDSEEDSPECDNTEIVCGAEDTSFELPG